MDDDRLFAEVRYRALEGRVDQLEDAVGFTCMVLAVGLLALAAWLLRSAPWPEVLHG